MVLDARSRGNVYSGAPKGQMPARWKRDSRDQAQVKQPCRRVLRPPCQALSSNHPSTQHCLGLKGPSPKRSFRKGSEKDVIHVGREVILLRCGRLGRLQKNKETGPWVSLYSWGGWGWCSGMGDKWEAGQQSQSRNAEVGKLGDLLDGHVR